MSQRNKEQLMKIVNWDKKPNTLEEIKKRVETRKQNQMNTPTEQPKIKPTAKQMKTVFDQLSAINRTGPGNVNPFRVIAEKHGDGSASTKALLRGLIKNWKPKHWEMWERAKNYCADLQRVKK